MRILLLNTSFPPQARSAAHLFHDLGVTLSQRGHAVSVVTEFPWRRLGNDTLDAKYRGWHLFTREEMDGMRVTRVRGFPFSESGMIGRGVNTLLLPLTFSLGAMLTAKPDVALVYSPPLTVGLAAFLYGRWRGVPFVFNVQDIYPQTLVELGLLKNPFLIHFFEWVEQFVYRRAARIVVHSEGNRQYLIEQRGVPPGKIVAIPNWVDTDALKPAERMNSFRETHHLGDRFVVCYAGTLGYAQDLEPILVAARELKTQPEILFLFVGEGVREQEWKERASALALTNARFLPLQPKVTYPALIAAMDIGLVPLTDALRTPVVPGKLLDIMAGARPAIAMVHPTSDTTRIIREARCGYAIPPNDADALRIAILKLYEARAFARQLGENGRAYALAHFSRAAGAEQYERLFESIINRRERRDAEEIRNPKSEIEGTS